MTADVDTARDSAWRTALDLASHDRAAAATVHSTAEQTVIRRLICAARGIDEALYWRMVERELRK